MKIGKTHQLLTTKNPTITGGVCGAPLIDESCSYFPMIEYKIIKKIKD